MTEERELEIVKLYKNSNVKIGDIGISGQELCRILKKYNVSRRSKCRIWTDEELNWLKENYPSKGAEYCANYLNRKSDQIYDKTKREGIKRDNKFVRPEQNPDLKILISWEEFYKLSDREKLPIECSFCHKTSYKTQNEIKQSIKRKIKRLFCSLKCHNKNQEMEFYKTLPPKERIEELIKQDLTLYEIGEVFGKNGNYAGRVLKHYGLETRFKELGVFNHPKIKEKTRLQILEYSNLYPEYYLSEISPACEIVKNNLRQRGISFKEEQRILLHLGYLYCADIVFEEYGTILEINGKQHYSDWEKQILNSYFQRRHDLLVKNGWKVFEVPTSIAVKREFLDDFLPFLSIAITPPNFEYKPLIEPKFCECGKIIKHKNQTCRKCKPEKRKCPVSKELLHWYLWNYNYDDLSCIFNVNPLTVRRWFKRADFKERPSGNYRFLIKNGYITDYQI